MYLLFAIICSASIALIFKYSESTRMNRYAITTVNYFTAFIVSFFLFITEHHVSAVNITSLKNSLILLLHGNLDFMTPSGSIIWAVFIGIAAGFLFYLSFLFYQISVRDFGASLSGMFMKLGILVPMIISIMFWNEWPNVYQSVGIFLSIGTIILVNSNFEHGRMKWKIGLLLLLLFGGLAEFTNKFYIKYALSEYKSLFLFFVFFTAFLISLFKLLKNKKTVKKEEIIIGFLVGIPNLFSSFFLIMALKTITTSVAFTLYSAGSIGVIIIGSRLIYRETIHQKEWLALGITIIAIILVNL